MLTQEGVELLLDQPGTPGAEEVSGAVQRCKRRVSVHEHKVRRLHVR